jgi:hypothetical protein
MIIKMNSSSKNTFTKIFEEITKYLLTWCKSQAYFGEAVLVALSFHVLMFPIVWLIGWALPWPKSPVITTVVEYDLQKWLQSGKTKNIFDYRDPNLNK